MYLTLRTPGCRPPPTLRTGSRLRVIPVNRLADADLRDIGVSGIPGCAIAAEGYRRAHADTRIEVVPFEPELIDSAVQLYRARPDKRAMMLRQPAHRV